jgi:hypothetical protein
MPGKTRLLAVDVDGTLLCGGQVLAQDASALRRAARAGMVVCLCTGRSWNEVCSIWQGLDLPLPHAPVVCVGGALVAEPDTGRTLYARAFQRRTADQLAQALRRMGYPVMLLVDGWREGFDYYLIGRYDDSPLYQRFYQGRGHRVRQIGRLDGACVRPLRVSVLEEPRRADQVVQALRQDFAGRIEVQAIFAPSYGVHIVEAFSAGANKFTALVYVGQGYGIGPSAMAAIGDDRNDLAMLRGVGLSATTADAPAELVQSAGLTLAARGGGAVAQFVEHLLGPAPDPGG